MFQQIFRKSMEVKRFVMTGKYTLLLNNIENSNYRYGSDWQEQTQVSKLGLYETIRLL